MKKLRYLALLVFLIPSVLFAGQKFPPQNLPSNTAYDATTWDANPDAATKDAIRDEFEGLLGGTAPFTSITVIPLSTTPIAIDIQGNTNDYTGAAAAVSFLTQRDINIGIGSINNYAGWQSYLTLKHTDAAINGDFFGYGSITRVDNQGNITNPGGTDRQYWDVGQHNTVKETGTYDTDGAGVLNLKFVGTYSWAWADGYTLKDTSTGAPANIVKTYGFESKVESLPTLNGSATATFLNAGLYIDEVTGNTAGTSTGYGIYIGPVSGSDTNYVIYSDDTDGSYLAGLLNAASLQESGIAVPNVNDNLSVFAATSSAQLLGVLSDETGSGLAVFANEPTLYTPTLNGPVKKPTSPAFLAISTAQSNVTGNGTTHTLTYATEVTDQANSFDGTSTFTAPVTGLYLLTASAYYSGYTTSTGHEFTIVTTNRSYPARQNYSVASDSNINSMHLSVIADMDVTDTATVQLIVSGATADVVDVEAAQCYFSGSLIN